MSGPHIAWVELQTPSGPGRVYYTRREIAGWTAPALLGTLVVPAAPEKPSVHLVATDGAGELFVAWLDERTDAPGLYARRFDLTSWSPATRLFAGWGVQADIDLFPPVYEIHAVSNALGVPCSCNDVLYASDTGTGWSAEESIGVGHTAGPLEWPREPDVYVAQDGAPHVIWRHETYDGAAHLLDDRLIYAVGGPTFTYEPLAVGRNAHQPMVGTSSAGDAAVIWSDDHDGSWDVYLATRPAVVAVPPDDTHAAALRAWPNPARGVVLLELPQRLERAVLVDAGGRAVRVLEPIAQGSAFSRFRWDGRDDRGHPAPAGVYTLRQERGGRSGSRIVWMP